MDDVAQAVESRALVLEKSCRGQEKCGVVVSDKRPVYLLCNINGSIRVGSVQSWNEGAGDHGQLCFAQVQVKWVEKMPFQMLRGGAVERQSFPAIHVHVLHSN